MLWRICALVVTLTLITGCVSTICGGSADCRAIGPNDDKLIRYHIGVVRELTPAVASPKTQVYASDLRTFGLWIDADTRPYYEDAKGIGIGLGVSRTRREVFPPECSFVVHVERPEDVRPVVDLFKEAEMEGKGVCIISQE